MQAACGTKPENALAVLDRVRQPQHVQIEGSWRRVEPLPRPAPSVRIVRAAGKTLLVWGGLSFAGVSGAALVYAHGGFPAELKISADAGPSPVEAAAIAPKAAPSVKPVRVVALQPPAAVPGAPRSPGAKITPASTTPAPAPTAPVSKPAVLAAAIHSAAPFETGPSRSADGLEPPVEARLPRPRPEEPVATASIERQWAELRAWRRVALPEAMRARLSYRYRWAPL